MGFLVVYFISLPYLQLLGPAGNHKAYPWISLYRNVNTMPVVKRGMVVAMGGYHVAG